MFRLTESPLMMGILAIAEVLPILLIGPIAGIIVDKVDRRISMATADVFQGIILLLVATSIIIPDTTIRALFLIIAAFFNSCAMRFFYPARSAAIPSLVPTENLSQANSITATIYQSTALLGPAVAGVVIAVAGYELAFTFDALTFFFSAVAILLISTNLKPDRTGLAQNGVSKDLRDGVQVLASSRVLQFIIITFSFLMFAAGAIFVLFIPYLTTVGLNTIGEAEAISGVIFSFAALTGVLTGILIGTRRTLIQRHPLTVMSGAILIAGLTMIGLAISPHWFLSMFVMGTFGAIEVSIGIPVQTTIQELVPDYLRGKVFAVQNIAVTVTQIIGMGLAGIMAETYSIALVFFLAGILTLLISVLGISTLFFGKLNTRIETEKQLILDRELSYAS